MNTIDILRSELEHKEIRIYQISKDRKQSVELFYIKKEIDIVRSTDTTDYTVTVYRDFEINGSPMRGSATAVIYPDMCAGEIGREIDKAYYAASFVKNKFYELPEGKHDEVKAAEYNLTAEAFRMADALFQGEAAGMKSFLNSAEIFADRHDYTILNSRGVDVCFTTYSFNGEFVTQCIDAGQDVELHTQFAYRTPECAQLTEKVRAALITTADRVAAVQPPKAGKYAVMFSGAYVRDLLGYYVSRASGGMIYAGYSSYQKDGFIQGDESEFRGEKLDINLKATIPYSAEGIRMADRPLVVQGILKTIPCGARYAYYLGIEPTGDYGAIECLNGTMSLEEMKESGGKVLYVAAFSDFQADELSGYFGGEIRLAYLYEKVNGSLQVTKLTGGSVNGSILEVQNTMVFSKERYKDNNYEGPFAVRFSNMSVAGV